MSQFTGTLYNTTCHAHTSQISWSGTTTPFITSREERAGFFIEESEESDESEDSEEWIIKNYRWIPWIRWIRLYTSRDATSKNRSPVRRWIHRHGHEPKDRAY